MIITDELIAARKALDLTQAELAKRAGLSRMTVQRTEAGDIDPRLSTLLEMARVLGMGLMMVPNDLRPELEAFLRSGGRFIGQAAGAGAPHSVVEVLSKPASGKNKR